MGGRSDDRPAGAARQLAALWRSSAGSSRRHSGCAVQANSYSTPRGSQGFAVHHDTHDVLVLQVAGEKRWLLYDPLLELPLKHQRYSKSLGDEGEPTDDLVLPAGDTLTCRGAGFTRRRRRRPTPPPHDRNQRLHVARRRQGGAWPAGARRRAAPRGGRRRLRGGRAGRTPARGWSSRRRRAAGGVPRHAPPDPRGRPHAAPGVERLGLDTLLERRGTVIADLERRGRGRRPRLRGQESPLPRTLGPRWLRASRQEPSPRGSPGGVDAAGRLVLVRRLVREGFLRIL